MGTLSHHVKKPKVSPLPILAKDRYVFDGLGYEGFRGALLDIVLTIRYAFPDCPELTISIELDEDTSLTYSERVLSGDKAHLKIESLVNLINRHVGCCAVNVYTVIDGSDTGLILANYSVIAKRKQDELFPYVVELLKHGLVEDPAECYLKAKDRLRSESDEPIVSCI